MRMNDGQTTWRRTGERMVTPRNWFFDAVSSVPKKGILVTLVYVALAVAIYFGFKHGWLDLRGRPIEHIRNLQAPVEERNRQIDELANPQPKSTKGDLR
jgi:hypothetical protein